MLELLHDDTILLTVMVSCGLGAVGGYHRKCGALVGAIICLVPIVGHLTLLAFPERPAR